MESIFISYSHNDKDFVDKLGLDLTKSRINIFIDRWEMNVGDSITNKIENALTESSHLIIVLSKSSVNSDWCKREITTGLMLEMERKRTVFLPIIIEDCEIPLFLRDKFYADFRTDYNMALTQIKESVSKFRNDDTGRVKMEHEIYSDYAMNWGTRGEYYEFNIDIVEYSINLEKPITILTNITFIGNEAATKRFFLHVKNGRPELMKSLVLMTCAHNKSFVDSNAYIVDGLPFETQLALEDPKSGINFTGFVTVKILGPYDKKNKIYYYGNIFTRLWEEDQR